MRNWWLGVVIAAGCGGGSGSAKDFCKKIDKLCSAGFTDEDIKECSEDIPKLKEPIGSDNYDKLLECGSSKSCAELAGCASGALANAGADALEDFERGFGRTFKDKDKKRDRDDRSDRRTDDDTSVTTRTRTTSRRRGGPFRRGEPLPPQCKRFDDLCGERDVIERSECLDRVDELNGDAARMAKLVACYEKATTCVGFETCSTEMWFDIQRDGIPKMPDMPDVP
jgi:hypothetical protein